MSYSTEHARQARESIKSALREGWKLCVSEYGLAWSEFFRLVVESLVDLKRESHND